MLLILSKLLEKSWGPKVRCEECPTHSQAVMDTTGHNACFLSHPMTPRRSTRISANETKRKEQSLPTIESKLTPLEKTHKPRPGKSAKQNDCGILPSEWYKIKASITESVPWGYICGYPISSGGDLYGGAQYIESAAASETLRIPQGIAIQNATLLFGNGARTLPFAPCKRGYVPICKETNERMYACSYHHKKRMERLKSEKWNYRVGEVVLDQFWSSLSTNSPRDEEKSQSKNKRQKI